MSEGGVPIDDRTIEEARIEKGFQMSFHLLLLDHFSTLKDPCL